MRIHFSNLSYQAADPFLLSVRRESGQKAFSLLQVASAHPGPSSHPTGRKAVLRALSWSLVRSAPSRRQSEIPFCIQDLFAYLTEELAARFAKYLLLQKGCCAVPRLAGSSRAGWRRRAWGKGSGSFGWKRCVPGAQSAF